MPCGHSSPQSIKSNNFQSNKSPKRQITQKTKPPLSPDKPEKCLFQWLNPPLHSRDAHDKSGVFSAAESSSSVVHRNYTHTKYTRGTTISEKLQKAQFIPPLACPAKRPNIRKMWKFLSSASLIHSSSCALIKPSLTSLHRSRQTDPSSMGSSASKAPPHAPPHYKKSRVPGENEKLKKLHRLRCSSRLYAFRPALGPFAAIPSFASRPPFLGPRKPLYTKHTVDRCSTETCRFQNPNPTSCL